MAPVEVKDDFYAVLEVSNTATFDVITKNYRRLAKIRHPDRNIGKHDSIAVFQDCKATLQNADRTIQYGQKKGATEDKAKQKEDDARQERFRRLNVTKSRYDSDIFEDQVDEDSRKERERNGWWAYMTSPNYGKVDETVEQNQARESARLHRLASKSIQGSELRDKEAKLKRLQSALQDVNSQIAVEKQKVEHAASAQIRERKATKEAREAQAAREAREAQEREWKAAMAAAAERRSMEAEERRRAMRAAEEAARKAEEAQRYVMNVRACVRLAGDT
ncbi:hypothetical protein EPUS_00804 [Endocarpon pusillum Z07020]|uniref:J domain-containing protein n=1 Tax=Endocarpon pusillum (strain Z07020 / HMAS-L-300199) TaxID=1263415 RepID=U1HYT8_ENDPU|nr:uncharacterized protein EPUS_00804 [Endocarpon pusillum Z07020]ERF74674.1 hypothetical protein EPUS_00804 [Endocarpon pusillum Z07020]